jgi:hypothetical protein
MVRLVRIVIREQIGVEAIEVVKVAEKEAGVARIDFVTGAKYMVTGATSAKESFDSEQREHRGHVAGSGLVAP